MMHDFHFLRPAWLLLLFALPLLWRVLKSAGNDAQAWRGAVDAHLLEHLLVRNASATPTRSPAWLAAAALVLASMALAGPAWERMPQPLYKNQAARVIALELSATMLAQDVKPSRYERARYKIADMLKRSGDAQVALIAYAGDAFVVAPLTDDANTVANLVDSLDPTVMPAPGNDTGRAIDLAVKLIHQAGVRDGEIVLLADGASADANAAAVRARSAGIRVSVLGIGSAQGAPIALGDGGFLKDKAGNIVLPKLDGAALAGVANAGGGRYAEYRNDAGDLDAVLGTLAQGGEAAKDAAGAEVQSERFLDRGPWLLLALLPLAALGFRRGWLMLLPLALFVHSGRAEASVWTDLWQRADQQAQAQLDAGKAKEAQALAKSPDLRGTAAYRAGDYAAATEDFAAAGTDNASADAQYNRGNALAKQAKFEEAIAAYDAALKQQPDMADAAANKKTVEDFLKKQQEQQKQQQNSSQDHQGNPQQQPGNDQPQDSKDSKDGKGDQQGQDGSEKKESKDPGKDDKGGSDQDGKKKDSQAQDKSSGQNKPGDEKNAAQQPKEGSEAGKDSQQKFQQSLDQALAKDGKDGQKPPPPVRLGAREADQRSEQNQAVEQWLQRVPDDPGGLLRRKFQLEHQRRQQGATQDDSP